MANYSTPYKLGKPVWGKDFYGRRRREKVESFLDGDCRHMLIIGLGMIGKTSFLRQVKHEANTKDKYRKKTIAIDLNFEKATDDTTSTINMFKHDILNNPSIIGLFKKKGIDPVRLGLEGLFKDLISISTEEKITIILMCDEIGKLLEIGPVGERLCNLIDSHLTNEVNHYLKVIAVSSPYVHSSIDESVPQWFKNVVVHLGNAPYYLESLTQDDAYKLCYLKQTGPEPPVSEKVAKIIVETCGGHPHFLKKLCIKSLEGEKLSEMENLITDEDRDAMEFPRDIKTLEGYDKRILKFLSLAGGTVRTLARKTKLPLVTVNSRLGQLVRLGLVTKKRNQAMMATPFYTGWILNILKVQKKKQSAEGWHWTAFSLIAGMILLLATVCYFLCVGVEFMPKHIALPIIFNLKWFLLILASVGVLIGFDSIILAPKRWAVLGLIFTALLTVLGIVWAVVLTGKV